MDRVDRRRIAIFLSTSGHSGVDRAMKHLIPALARRGYAVDLLKLRRHGPNLAEIPPGVRVIDTGARTTYLALFALLRYLRHERPAVLLADKDRVNRTALLARWWARAKATRLVLRLGTTVSVDLQHRGWFERALQRWSMGRLYRHADAVIVPGRGVAEDMAAYTGLPRARITVVPSPLVPTALLQSRPPRPAHPWFADGAPPVILGVGELSPRKDFVTLLRAFAQLRAQRPCRLLVLGEGRERLRLFQLADALGVAADFALPGFVEAPFGYMAHAAVFALCSRWEGLPAAPVEALAAGTPVVATDTPGSREILAGGALGPLLPPGDAAALAAALAEVLDRPCDRGRLQAAARPYEIETATSGYLRVFALPDRVDA